MAIVTPILLLMSSFCFALGLTLPLMRFEKLYFFSETPNLIAIVMSLFDDGEWLLSTVIALFSIGLPALKLVVLFIAAYRGSGGRSVAVLSAVSKWSMMDVMIVALVIFAAKTSGFASAVTLPGLWFYAAATLTSAVGAELVRR